MAKTRCLNIYGLLFVRYRSTTWSKAVRLSVHHRSTFLQSVQIEAFILSVEFVTDPIAVDCWVCSGLVLEKEAQRKRGKSHVLQRMIILQCSLVTTSNYNFLVASGMSLL